MTVSKQELDKVAALYARGFYNDPLFVYFFPDDKTRESLSFHTFRFVVAHAFSHGFVNRTSASLEGAATWLPSEKLERGLLDQIRFGALKMVIKQGVGSIQRQLNASEYMQAVHKKHLSEPHLYLSLLTTDNAYRGKGYASKLFAPTLKRADQQRLPCYLDTHNEANVSLYKRFGFQVAEESKIPNSDVTHWGMVRFPKGELY